MLLFTLVGTQVNVDVALKAGLSGVALISLGLAGRSIGAYLCLLGSSLNLKERFFVVIAYLPKATGQAAIGAAPLAAMKFAGINPAPGDIILTVAALKSNRVTAIGSPVNIFYFVRLWYYYSSVM